ncbi:uncharacterized protein BT62DRAFT_957771, partial [Guyanagaster necrorhizus]
MEDLGMRNDRIQLLLGSEEHPTRVNIIGALLSIITNPQIAYGDNIIIYYSGHGSSYPASEPDDDEGENGTVPVEAFCPIDRDMLDANDNPIPDISDREFNTILTLIAGVKGHHITVIFDCCHSGSVSR